MDCTIFQEFGNSQTLLSTVGQLSSVHLQHVHVHVHVGSFACLGTAWGRGYIWSGRLGSNVQGSPGLASAWGAGLALSHIHVLYIRVHVCILCMLWLQD